MAHALRRLSLEPVVLGAIPVTIVAVACAASWSVSLRDAARPVRALALVALCGLALAFALRRRAGLGAARRVHIAAGAFLVVSAVSAGWSVGPRQTAARIAAFTLLLVASAALAAAVAGRRDAARRLLFAVLAGATVVAVVGAVVYLVSPHDAVQPATGNVAARFRGIGESPNTTAMLFAVALPIAPLLVLEARSGAARLAGGAAFLLLAGSIGFSASRGALVAACAGLLVFGVGAARRPAWRAAGAAAVAVFAGLVVAVSSIPAPLSPAAAAKAKSPSANTERRTPNDAEYTLRLQDEIGYGSSGGFWQGSGRLAAWRGALHQAAWRPLLGYGFGTEARVFVDRFAAFQGGVPENSFVGILLQLGIAGLALLVSLLALLVVAAVRLLRIDRRLAAACGGVLAAGLALAFVQSYLYAIGNTATLAVWVSAFIPTVRAVE